MIGKFFSKLFSLGYQRVLFEIALWENFLSIKFNRDSTVLHIKIFFGQDGAPDVEEPVIDALEKKSAELTKGDKDKERPDVNDVEDKTSNKEDGEVLNDEYSVHDRLAQEAALLDFVLLDLLFLGRKGEDQVVHVQ